ncbi:MAG: CDP-alcohol phosphatidyltransferase family protein [Gammaproteobacteria bacterium]|nr:CDP-alcohol phosphatidyltransferase family protein [Gammaproteobacteria bacterium]
MNDAIRIVGNCDRRVWGMTGAERIRRMLASLGTPMQGVAPASTVLLLRADHIYDARLLEALARSDGAFQLRAGDSEQAVAARVPVGQEEAAGVALSRGAGPALDALMIRRPADLVAGFELRLRKFEPARVHDISHAELDALERELFGGAYKGVTDLVTKWLWPVPAFHATHLCIRAGLRPNHVTLFGLLLAILAAIAFAQGEFAAGLAMAWFMTFLDTVDGKLARVTVTSSRFGDYLDHGIDLLHPPIWYAAWGMGVAAQWDGPVPLATVLWLMLAGYIGGRLCEGAFQLFAASFSLFVWRPLDSFNRLITARRNPNLILLTLFWGYGDPAQGLWAVVIWHLASTAFLLLRVSYAVSVRWRTGPLVSWLAQVDPARDRDRLAVRVFTRAPA